VSVDISKFGQVDGISESRYALAEERDGRVRELERQHVSCWSEMAGLCQVIEEQEDWRILNFSSFNRWLLDAAPQSRSAMYAARGLLKELEGVETKDLRQIPLGSAKVLAAVPKRSRTKKLIQLAKRPPREFKAHVQDNFPDLHIETSNRRSFEFKRSQEKIIDGAIAMVNILEAGEVTEEQEMSEEEALTLICKFFMEKHEHEYGKIIGK
jgi:hypothetical protein